MAEVPALGTNLVALGSLGPSAPSATPNSASAAHLGPAWPILRHAAILRAIGRRCSSTRMTPGAGRALCVHAARSEIDTHAGGA